jgi:hypothetical protein
VAKAKDMIDDAPKKKQKRGFACMDVEKRRLIAIKGGGSVKPENRSFARDRKLAMTAGKKGGLASRGGGRKARHPTAETIDE